MSTRHDRNYRSYDSDVQLDAADVTLWPTQEPGWLRGSWQDTLKFYKRNGRNFARFTVVDGGAEDAVDVSPLCCGNTFSRFDVDGGDAYVLTLKGGSCRNIFDSWFIRRPGGTVDIEIGNWSSTNFERSVGNRFLYWRRSDDLPVTYCYRLGCKPEFVGMKVRHLWWRSLGLTVYWWSKYVWHVLLRRPDA